MVAHEPVVAAVAGTLPAGRTGGPEERDGAAPFVARAEDIDRRP